MKRALSGALLVLLVLSGCGGGGERTSEPEASAEAEPEPTEDPANAGGYGTYALAPETGGVIRVTFEENPEVPSDELVTRAERMREDADGDPIQWLPVSVDNSEGTETIAIDYGVEVVTEDGDTIEAQDPNHRIGDWATVIDDLELTGNLEFEWSEEYQEQILPGAKYEGFMMLQEQLDGPPARVFYNGVQGYLSD